MNRFESWIAKIMLKRWIKNGGLMKLNGIKTYIVAGGAVLTAVGAYLNGAMDLETTIQTVFGALAAASIRHGMTTETKK